MRPLSATFAAPAVLVWVCEVVAAATVAVVAAVVVGPMSGSPWLVLGAAPSAPIARRLRSSTRLARAWLAAVAASARRRSVSDGRGRGCPGFWFCRCCAPAARPAAPSGASREAPGSPAAGSSSCRARGRVGCCSRLRAAPARRESTPTARACRLSTWRFAARAALDDARSCRSAACVWVRRAASVRALSSAFAFAALVLAALRLRSASAACRCLTASGSSRR